LSWTIGEWIEVSELSQCSMVVWTTQPTAFGESSSELGEHCGDLQVRFTMLTAQASLLGFGVTAIYPYLLLATAGNLVKRKRGEGIDLTPTVKRIRGALNAGLLKIMSKRS